MFGKRKGRQARAGAIKGLERWHAAYDRACDAGTDCATALGIADAALARADGVKDACDYCGGHGHVSHHHAAGTKNIVCHGCHARQQAFRSTPLKPTLPAAPPPESPRRPSGPRARLSPLAERTLAGV